MTVACGYCSFRLDIKSFNALSCGAGMSAGFSVSTQVPTTSICIDCRLSLIASSRVSHQFLVENQPAGSVIGTGLMTVQLASII